MENIIIKIIITLVQAISSIYFCIVVASYFKSKINIKNTSLAFIGICFSIVLTPYLKAINPIFNIIVGICLFTLIFMFTFKTNFSKSFFVGLLYMILFSITEAIITLAITVILKVNIDVIKNSNALYTLFILAHALFNILIIFIVNKIHTKRSNTLTSNSISINNISINKFKILIILFLICVIPQLLLFVFLEYEYPFPLIVMNIIQILFASFLILSYFKIIIRQEAIQNELTTSELHNKTLIEIVDGVRTLKHDYGNIVQALNGYVVTKQYDKLGEYVNSLIKEFSSVNNVSAIDPKIFNEPAIYGVVGAKYFYATDNDITFEIEVTSDIKSISFSKPELSRIFGILLDNAIEATQKIENKYIKLEISFNDNKYADVIRIINTYDTSIDIDLEKIYEKGVSSKEVKSGIGLWEVAKLVNRNKHSQIYATIEKDKFVQNLIIERID